MLFTIILYYLHLHACKTSIVYNMYQIGLVNPYLLLIHHLVHQNSLIHFQLWQQCYKLLFREREYRIARKFRGLKFSRMSLKKTFRDLIFEDYLSERPTPLHARSTHTYTYSMRPLST